MPGNTQLSLDLMIFILRPLEKPKLCAIFAWRFEADRISMLTHFLNHTGNGPATFIAITEFISGSAR